MAQPGDVLRNPANGHQLTFRRTAASSGGEVVEVEAAYERATAAPPAHFHPRQTERYVGLGGAVHFRVDGRLVVLREGDELVVPPRAVHQVWAEEPGRVLWQTMPAMRTDDLLEALWRVAIEGHVGRDGHPAPLHAVAAVAPFTDEFRIPRVPAVVQRCVCGLAARLVRR